MAANDQGAQASNVPMPARQHAVFKAPETRAPMATVEGDFRNDSCHLAVATRAPAIARQTSRPARPDDGAQRSKIEDAEIV